MTGTPGIGALPPGVPAPRTDSERKMYQQALQLEGVFTQHLVDAMMESAQPDADQSGGMGIYHQMINQQLNDALVDSGGLGVAGSLYAQLRGVTASSTGKTGS